MIKKTNTIEKPANGWQLKLGIGMFIVSILLPVIGVPLMAKLDFSAAVTTTLSGGLLVAAEVLGLAAVAVMGKDGYIYIKKRFSGILKQYGPPDDVSPRRYTTGLVLLSIPLVFGWASLYIRTWIPGFETNPLFYAVAGDIMLLSSLIVLGGNFWDKVRALFIHSAKACFHHQ